MKQFDVTLRNKAGKTELVTKEDVDVVDALGGKFADAGAKLCRELDIKGGVQVVGIKADRPMIRALCFRAQATMSSAGTSLPASTTSKPWFPRSRETIFLPMS